MENAEMKCGHKMQLDPPRQVAYEVIEYPFNPEWPLRHVDAGLFCSDHCLFGYLAIKLAKDTTPTPGES